jgi:FMN phosphatase YigB (HAD superfamily)
MVFLDLDNTLIDRAEGFRRWARTLLAGIGHVDEDELQWLVTVDEEGLCRRPTFFELIKDRYALAEPVDLLVARFYEALPRHIPPLDPQTVDALIRARRNDWTLCVVTNGSAVQHTKIQAAGLLDLVDCCVISGEVGCAKPDPRIVTIAAEMCDMRTTRDDWLVGDRPEIDILCAVQAGIRSAWIQRDGSWTEPTYRPTISVPSVAAALDRILEVADPSP